MMEINQHHLNVEAHGPESGPMIILLHHGLGSLRAWRKNLKSFVDAGFRVVEYDRWGYGGSDIRDGLGVPCFEEDVKDLAVLQENLNKPKTFLVGHSDGATIALLYAACFPERVIAMVSVGAHIYIEPRLQQGIKGVFQSYSTDDRFRRALAQIHGDKVDLVFKNWYEGWLQLEDQDWDLRPVLRTIRCPVLVIQGEADEHATKQHALDLAQVIPQAELWLIPDEGHMFPQHQPEIFNQGVLNFLEKNRGIQ